MHNRFAGVGLVVAAVAFAAPKVALKVKPVKDAVVVVVPGKSIAGVEPGQTIDQAKKKGLKLTPDVVERSIGKGWVAGALLLIADARGTIKSISVEVAKTPGLLVGDVAVAPGATFNDIYQALKGCTRSQGASGAMLECTVEGAGAMHFFEGSTGAVRLVMP